MQKAHPVLSGSRTPFKSGLLRVLLTAAAGHFCGKRMLVYVTDRCHTRQLRRINCAYSGWWFDCLVVCVRKFWVSKCKHLCRMHTWLRSCATMPAPEVDALLRLKTLEPMLTCTGRKCRVSSSAEYLLLFGPLAFTRAAQNSCATCYGSRMNE